MELGERARAQLIRAAAPIDIGWDNLFWTWTKENKRLTQNSGTLRAYEGAVNALAAWAKPGWRGRARVKLPTGRRQGICRAGVRRRRKEIVNCLQGFLRGWGWITGFGMGHDLAVPVAGRFRRIAKDEMVRLLEAAADPVSVRCCGWDFRRVCGWEAV